MVSVFAVEKILTLSFINLIFIQCFTVYLHLFHDLNLPYRHLRVLRVWQAMLITGLFSILLFGIRCLACDTPDPYNLRLHEAEAYAKQPSRVCNGRIMSVSQWIESTVYTAIYCDRQNQGSQDLLLGQTHFKRLLASYV